MKAAQESTHAFVIAHYMVDLTPQQVADHLGMKVVSVKTMVCRLRKKGFDIAGKIAPVGTERVVNNGNRGMTVRRKQEDGSWKFVRYLKEPAPKPKKVPKKKKAKKKSAPLLKQSPAKVQKVARIESKGTVRGFSKATDNGPVRNDRNSDEVKIRKEEGGQWVRLNDKTVVYRKNVAA